MIYESRTAYSRVRVYQRGATRCLTIVHDDGAEAVQTCIDFARPGELFSDYLRAMAQCHLLVDPIGRVLLVGLGGGALAHYYRARHPQVRVDAVEIDRDVVRVAEQYFALGACGNLRVFCGDACALAHLGCASLPDQAGYDAIYVDAFLRPQPGTTASGAAACTRDPRFLAGLGRCLRAGGAAAFNCHDGADDAAAVVRAFPRSYEVPVKGQTVVIGVTP